MPATSMVGGRIPTSHCWPGQGVQGALVLYRGRGGFSSLPLYNPPSNPKSLFPSTLRRKIAFLTACLCHCLKNRQSVILK